MNDIHPAILAAHHSWRCVQARAREHWLELMAEDVAIEDPVGLGPTNPTGKGFRGKREAEQFWDTHLAPTQSVPITRTSRSPPATSPRTCSRSRRCSRTASR